MLWRLLIGTIMMLGFGLTGETGGINAQVEFVFGMSGWAYILYMIYLGDAGRVCFLRDIFNLVSICESEGLHEVSL